MSPLPPTIGLEEHFFCTYAAQSSQYGQAFKDYPPYITTDMRSLDEIRLAPMNKCNMAKQVISHPPLGDNPSEELCISSNDELATGIKAHPDRFAAFANLPMYKPDAAAAELERCVKTYGFVGALIGGHVSGAFYDADFFWPVFAKAVELDVPLYIHPVPPTADMAARFQGNYSPRVARDLAAFSWDWHSACGIAFVRMYGAGVFDKFPTLKLILGHMGEMVTFSLDRIINFTHKWGDTDIGPWPAWTRQLRQVWNENVWITTSGMFTLAPFAAALQNTKIDRILYSVDWPFEELEEGVEFLEKVRSSGLVTEAQLEMIAHGNAERLLGIKI